jgi:hypothetical protein
MIIIDTPLSPDMKNSYAMNGIKSYTVYSFEILSSTMLQNGEWTWS